MYLDVIMKREKKNVVFRLECHEIMDWIGLDWKYGAKNLTQT